MSQQLGGSWSWGVGWVVLSADKKEHSLSVGQSRRGHCQQLVIPGWGESTHPVESTLVLRDHSSKTVAPPWTPTLQPGKVLIT